MTKVFTTRRITFKSVNYKMLIKCCIGKTTINIVLSHINNFQLYLYKIYLIILRSY